MNRAIGSVGPVRKEGCLSQLGQRRAEFDDQADSVMHAVYLR
jgi:hypothetical protein